ncbi:N-acetylmuramoyl-L-alanine amidase [Metabacillus halosaccharovorans]|uniref:N-acetylmuramoyl-L-alanine amidase n=1 Tax=Metabacillus halosaccharovorans TaxID=930124 RepID=UPI00203DFB27|nr:N-acetylmuramoyl-L-alanine amidase [Metabacillus halosaccharovorans]MCM3444395.1 N-acetylmuramoyl-L-alanine amidase [Metabacillus halosaccharovorans]
MNKFYISSGHGKYVRGASSYIDEVNEARKIVEQVADNLKSMGCTVYEFHDNSTRTQRDNINTIVRNHNSKSRDLDVSVHLNAASKTNDPRGVEVLYVSNAGKQVAEKVSEAISKASGLKNRGAKKRTNLGFLNGTSKTAILIEVCFVDSKTDVEIYKAKFNEICEAIAESLSDKQVSNKAKTVQAPKTEVKSEVVNKPSKGGNTVVKEGDRGLIVKTIQTLVGASNDGIYGPKTEAKVKAFQKSKGLSVDGIVGKNTWKALTGDEGGLLH